MKTVFLLILAFLLVCPSSRSQSCLPNGIGFATQAEVANFANNYPGCTVIEGTVNISGANINNLNGLSPITAVGALYIGGNPLLNNVSGLGNLTTIVGDARVFYNNKLANFNGMDQLVSVGTDFMVDHNPALTNFSGLDQLSSVGQDFTIATNYALANLEGLNSLDSVGRYFTIEENALQSLQGLQGLRSLPGHLIIRQNYYLQDLGGLDSLAHVAGGFQLWNNQALSNLQGLGSLAHAGSFIIAKCDSLTDLSGLGPNLTVDGTLGFQFNPALTSLQGLEHVKKVVTLLVNDNPALTSLNGLDSVITVGETLQIYKNTSLTALNSLHELTSIGTIFLLEGNPALAELDGLEKLDSIGGYFSIQGNLALTDLDELKNLRTINGSLYLLGNAALTNVNGLEQLRTIGYDFQLSGNAALTSLQGLGNLRQVAQRLIIDQNNSLTNLSGLDSLHTVGNNLQIVANPLLQDLTGLGSLETIGGILYIYQNPVLISLHGLDRLASVGQYVQILQNPLLSDCAIEGLCNLMILNPGSINFEIHSNAPGCNGSEIIFECTGVPIRATVQLDADGDCLPDSAAATLPGIQVLLSGDLQTRLRQTQANGAARFGYADFWKFNLSLPQFPAANWAVCADTLFFDQPETADTIRATFLLTPLHQCPELTLDLWLPATFRGCLVNSPVQISVQNTGTVPATGVQAAVVLPPVFDLVNAVPPVTGQSGDSLFFNLGELLPFASANLQLVVKTRCDTFLLNQTLCWEAFAKMVNPCPSNLPGQSDIKLSAECVGDSVVRFTLLNIGAAPTQAPHKYTIIKNEHILSTGLFSLDPQQSMIVDVPADGATYRMEATKHDDGSLTARGIENCRELTPGLITAFWLDRGPLEYDFDCRQVIGSFDPNLKSALPTGIGPDHRILANRPLQYTIDFQNTGTDTAFRVLLRDVLPANLDVSTFRPGAASHPYTWEIRQQNILEVLFFPIALPDSNVNEAASHGFFTFQIGQKPDLPDGSTFENTASIIFDFNPPIVTNTVRHTIGQLTVHVEEAQAQATLWQVLGNPTRDLAAFRAETFIAGEKRFDLYNVNGQRVRSAQFSGQAFEFRRDGLASGLYFFKISDAQGRVFAGKIVVAEP